MKKILSLVIVLTLMMSLCASAFAAGSPVVEPGNPQDGPISIVDPNDPDAVKFTIPPEAIVIVTIDQADALLSPEDAAAFKEAYAAAQSSVDCKVYKCYWLYIDEEIAGINFKGVSSDSALAFKFNCPNQDVKFMINGNDMKVIHKSGISYIALVADIGTVTITCD